MEDENTDTYKRSPTPTPGGLRKEGLSGGEGKADQSICLWFSLCGCCCQPVNGSYSSSVGSLLE